MSTLSELLGQDDLVRRVFASASTPGTAALRLSGPSGSGKSHVAAEVAREWTDRDGQVLMAIGDDRNVHRSLHPLLSAMSSARYPPSVIAMRAARSTVEVIDSAAAPPAVRGAATATFDLLRMARQQRESGRLLQFSTTEREIITWLCRLARRKPLLLVADNAHWWDHDSLWLLERLLSPDLRDNLRGLQNLVVLLVDTVEGQRAVAPVSFGALVEHAQNRVFHTRRCRPDQLADVLDCFGYDVRRDATVLDALYLTTGGHLKLIEQIAAYLVLDRARNITDLGRMHLAALFSERLASQGEEGRALAKLLGCAAVVGLSFGSTELQCVSDEDECTVESLMSRAQDLVFVVAEQEGFSFAHEVVRRGILAISTTSDLREHRRKFAECLAKLRPGDYSARSSLLTEGGEPDQARTMRALAAAQALREAKPSSRVLGDLDDGAADPGLLRYVTLLAEASDAVNRGDFASFLPQLMTAGEGESELMAAERNYAASLHEVEQQSRERAAQAADRLHDWENSLDNEPEMDIRFKLLRQQALIIAERYEEAKALETTMERILHRRTGFDTEAAFYLQRQNRRAGALRSPEIAEAAITEAVAFFRRGTGRPERDHVELYRSLNNLAAIQLRLGKDHEAYETALDCERVVVAAATSFPRLDVLGSNLVLAGTRSGAFDPMEAVIRQRVVVESDEGSGDKFLHRCNLSAFCLLAGDDESARSLINELEAELVRDGITESYLVYYLGVIRIAAAVFEGDLDFATQRHSEIESYVRALNWPGAPYVRRRMSLLPGCWSAVDTENRLGSDEVLMRAHPSEVGPAWPYYARLLPCAELSFWSDS